MNPEAANDYFNSPEVQAGVNANVSEAMKNAIGKASEIPLLRVTELIKSLHNDEESTREDARTELETIKMTLQNVVDLSSENDPLAVSFSKTIAEIENALATTN